MTDSRLYFPYYDVGGLPLSFGSGEPDESYRNVRFIYSDHLPFLVSQTVPNFLLDIKTVAVGIQRTQARGSWSEVKELSLIKLKK
jgi:hypothetical protein